MRSLLFISLIITSFTLNAAELSIRMSDGSNFLFQLDNSYFNKPERVYNLINVSEGYHFVQVYRVTEYGDTKLAFKGHIYVPDHSLVKAVVERDRRIKVSTEYVKPAPAPVYVPTNPNTITNPAPPASSNITPVSDQEFEEIKASVDKISFSSTKLSTAKSALNGKYVTSSQVASLVKTFVFESDKIELAKYCYDITVDRSKYYLVNDSFSFASSIEELNDFINKKSK